MANVLVIDDDEEIRGMLKTMLQRANYAVLEAANGVQGLQIFSENNIDLVITDIIMPEKEGLQTIKELKMQDSDIKIIAMSGGGRTPAHQYLTLASAFGAIRILEKPFQMSELLNAISATLN